MQKASIATSFVLLIVLASIHTSYPSQLDDDYTVSHSAENWTDIEIYNSSQSSILKPSIVTDSNHFSHAVFIDSQVLYHTTNLSGQWVTTVVDNDVYYNPSVAIDQDDVLHIAYHKNSSSCGCLGYATNAGGSWDSQIIDPWSSMSFDARWTDVEIDSSGNVIIVYFDDDFFVGIADDTSGSWNHYTLDLTPGPFEDYAPDYRGGNLILDSNDAPHIVWFDGSNNMHYSTNKTGAWVDHVFPDYAPTTGDIAVDSNDNIHIVFSKHEWDEDNLSYYNNIGGSWTNYSIDNTIAIAPHRDWTKSLIIDQDDNLHIAVVESGTNDLVYLDNTQGHWTSKVVVNSTDVVLEKISMALDDSGTPYIAYVDHSNSSLSLTFIGQDAIIVLDDDNDGVPNDSDQCPNTPAGSSVDANGCAFGESDLDSDGVSDLLDNCPNTPSNESVDIYGCSQSQLDDDNDGVMNDSDLCPNTPAGESVDTVGCGPSQQDDDNDGVPNESDLCSNTPANESVDLSGCSQSQLDDDSDGVMNDSDLCPNTPANESVDVSGCSQSQLDDDGDGISNADDLCPETMAGQSVDGSGCSQSQLDDDGDGIVNSVDQCPNTPAGANVNAQGCNRPPTCTISYENSSGQSITQVEDLEMYNGNTTTNIELISDVYIFNIICTDPEGDQVSMLVSIDGGTPIAFYDSPVNSGPITVPVQDGMNLTKTLSYYWSDDANSGSYSMDITLSGDDTSSNWIPGFEPWLVLLSIVFSLIYRRKNY